MVKNKILEIINSATTTTTITTSTAFENEIPNVSNLVKIIDYSTKNIEIKKKISVDHHHDNKYYTTQELNKSTSEKFTARLKQANLASKNCIANFLKKIDFDNELKTLNKNITSNKTNMYLLKMN